MINHLRYYFRMSIGVGEILRSINLTMFFQTGDCFVAGSSRLHLLRFGNCFVADSSPVYFLLLGNGYKLPFFACPKKGNRKKRHPDAALFPVKRDAA